MKKKISLLPTLISLFSGWGGGSLGFHLANFLELLAVDFDKHSRECFKLNFPNVPIYGWDLMKTTGDELLKSAGINRGELDVLLLSPPCQGISTAGKFDPNNPLNKLSLRSVDFINEIQPKVFVFENVSGIMKGGMQEFLVLLLSKMDTINYRYKFDVLNTLHYGVPQIRERFIVIGVRKDLGIEPVFPKPDLVGAEKLRVKDVTPKIQLFTQGYRNNIKIKSQNAFFGTLTKTRNSWAYTDGVQRKITSAEVLKLCSYPDSWLTTGSEDQIWARAGNSIMPLFAKAIAETIKTEILDQIANQNHKQAA